MKQVESGGRRTAWEKIKRKNRSGGERLHNHREKIERQRDRGKKIEKKQAI